MVFKGFKMEELGSLIFKCFQNVMSGFSMRISRGYRSNSALHMLFSVFLSLSLSVSLSLNSNELYWQELGSLHFRC